VAMEKKDYFSNTLVFMEEKGKNAPTKRAMTIL
jgi:hypothetical protein